MTITKEQLLLENQHLKISLEACKAQVHEQKKTIELEQLVSSVSRNFVSGYIEDTDGLINYAIESVGKLIEVDRCYLFLYSDNGQTVSCTHEWCAPGIAPEIDNLQEVPSKATQWWHNKVSCNEIILLKSLDDLPPEAASEKEILAAQSILSLLVVPVFHSGKAIGFLGFDAVKTAKEWADSHLSLLRMLAEVLAGHFRNIYSVSRLRKSEEKYRLLMESIDDSVVVLDEEGFYCYVNEAACQGFELSEEEITGRNIYDFYDREAADGFLSDVRSVINSGTPLSKEYGFYYKKIFRWFLLKIQPLLQEDGLTSKVLIYGIDVHERKQNELKSRVVSMASHEFRTPLSTILMATESLEAYYNKMSALEINKKLGRIKAGVSFLRGVMEKVLDLSRLEDGKMNFRPSSQNIQAFIQKVIDGVQHQLEICHKIGFKSLTPDLVCYFDPQMLREVLVNLISNAAKYSGSCNSIEVSLYKKSSNIIIAVSDKGIGILDEDKPSVFEPFYRGKNVNSIRGIGLGLSLSREFVKLHKGTLTFKTQLNTGTTFFIELPEQLV